MNYKIFESSERNVWKYVFTKQDKIAEAVLYKYDSFETRTVICCSVMSGCPVGCKFCGTGSNFISNLTSEEIVDQIEFILKDKQILTEKIKKFQIMFMSMGEPMLNWANVRKAIEILHQKYNNAQLLISTVGIKDKNTFNDIIDLSEKIDKVGLQFSIHESTDEKRNILIPFKNKMNLKEIAEAGEKWYQETGRKPYLNYCVNGNNNTDQDFTNLNNLFDPKVFCFTFSVICSKDETMKDASYRNLSQIYEFRNRFLEAGYNTRVFDPAGQDDIGGGCGQLWYVQKHLKEMSNRS